MQEKESRPDIAEVMRQKARFTSKDADRILLGRGGVSPEIRPLVALQLQLEASLSRKLPIAFEKGIFAPNRLSVEQASSELAAAYKARFVQPTDIVADLTGGLGIDALALAHSAKQTYYIEQQEELVRAAHYNFPLLAPNPPEIIAGRCENILPHLLEGELAPTLVYADPARRGGYSGEAAYERRYALADSEPNIVDVIRSLPKGRGTRLLVKTSPMLDIRQLLTELPATRELHIVSVRRELKELLLLIKPSDPPLPLEEIPISVVEASGDGTDGFRFTLAQEAACEIEIEENPLEYLYEPSAGILKSGAFRLWGKQHGLKPLAPNSHIYTSSMLVRGLAARTFRLDRAIPFHRQEVKMQLKNVPAAAITVRNFPLSADDLRKKLRLKDADTPVILGTTLSNGEHVLLLSTPITHSSNQRGGEAANHYL